MEPTARGEIQNRVVEMITRGLEEGTISEDRARAIAKLVLEQLPENMTEEELLTILPKLDDEFKEMTEVILPVVMDYEKKIREEVQTKVIGLVRARKFSEALAAARKGIDDSSKLFD